MLQNLIDSTPDNIALIQHYIATSDSESCQQLLHKLRGSYATLGADELVKQSLQLEHQLASTENITQQRWQDFFSVYRQSCDELQAIIREHSLPVTESGSELDLCHLHTLLKNQDMTACSVVAKNKFQLNQFLSEVDADKFLHQVAILDFAKAALLLQKYLPTDDTEL
ncbi:Hpt domain-containing protein [Arsukibacterium sp.]|uniref:Hpt domain-containing protein n=1 Tax=Arsukibacterium sp. TaxID=1977258 RepID=UPI003564EAA3